MGLGTYLQTLAQAVLGQSATQPSPQPSVPQQPQGASSSPSTAPTSGGFMQGASNFLGNPLTQAALSGYFNAIGQPKLAGPLAKVSAGGLGALQGFNTAEAAQSKTAEEQIAMQKAQADLAAGAQQQKVFSGLNPQQQQVAAYPSLATFQEKAAITEHNKQAVAAFQAGRPNDQGAAAFSMPYASMQTAVSPGDIEKDYQTKLLAPGALTKQSAEIAEEKARTTRLNTQPAAGTVANWYNPNHPKGTSGYYRGTQKSLGDIPASVAQSSKSDAEVKARAATYQKAYAEAAANYIKTNTKTDSHWMGPATKTPPSQADVDAYARQQAEQQTNALFGTTGTPAGVAASGGASADEPSAATNESDPLSLIPEGGTPAMKGDVHGYTDSSGAFHSVE